MNMNFTGTSLITLGGSKSGSVSVGSDEELSLLLLPPPSWSEMHAGGPGGVPRESSVATPDSIGGAMGRFSRVTGDASSGSLVSISFSFKLTEPDNKCKVRAIQNMIQPFFT